MNIIIIINNKLNFINILLDLKMKILLNLEKFRALSNQEKIPFGIRRGI